jgi:hypothetical protein
MGTPASAEGEGTAPRATEIAARIRNPTPKEIAAVAKLSPTKLASRALIGACTAMAAPPAMIAASANQTVPDMPHLP